MTRIPLEVADLTAGWLTEVLQPLAPGAVVEAVRVGDANSGTTGRARLEVDCPDERVPQTVFVKLAPFSDERRAFVDAQNMGVSEARFYRDLAHEVPVRTPNVLHSSYDDEGRYIMVFEDLLATGAHYPTQDDAGLVSVVDGVIDNFASLHAAFHGSSRFDSGGDLEWIEQRSRGYGAAGMYIEQAAKLIGAEMPSIFHEMVALYVPNDEAVAALLAAGDRTLVHGDAHIGNMFVEPAGVGFLDWAVLGYAPGVRDVAYFVNNSVTTEFRREHERRLIERYCGGIGRNGVHLTFDEAWNQYRLQTITGWIAAVATAGFGSALQPIEIGMRATQRANIALEDLDIVGLFRSVL